MKGEATRKVAWILPLTAGVVLAGTAFHWWSFSDGTNGLFVALCIVAAVAWIDR